MLGYIGGSQIIGRHLEESHWDNQTGSYAGELYSGEQRIWAGSSNYLAFMQQCNFVAHSLLEFLYCSGLYS